MSKNTLAIQESTSELKITRKKFEKTTKELQNTNDLLLDVASRPREARAIPVDVSDDIKERLEQEIVREKSLVISCLGFRIEVLKIYF